MLGVWFISSVNNLDTSTTTVDRKFFHMLVCIVYIPAICTDFRLIFFCSAIVMFGFLLIEVKEARTNTMINFRYSKQE